MNSSSNGGGTAVAQTENPPTGYNLANIPFLPPIEQAWAIIEQAIASYNPVCAIPLYSAGYDSLVSTHVAHGLALSIPLYTYSINTHLHADGRAHDTYRQRPTDWCPTCYREWLNNYPQNVNHFYATLFEKEENRDHRTGASFHAPFTPQNNRSMV